MANKDNPSGASAVGPILKSNVYPKGTNAAIYPGDWVIQNAAGNVVVATAGSTELMGVALGYAAATAVSVLVADDPDQHWYMQDDGVGGTLAATNVGNNIDILATAGNATYLKSQQELDTSTVTSAAAQLRILDKHPDDAYLDNVRMRVVANEHSWAKKLAGL